MPRVALWDRCTAICIFPTTPRAPCLPVSTRRLGTRQSNHFNLDFYSFKLAGSTSNMTFRAGRRPVQRLTTSLPLVTTQRLVVEVSLPVRRETGGLEDMRIDPPKSQRQEQSKETVPKALSLLHPFRSRADTFRS